MSNRQEPMVGGYLEDRSNRRGGGWVFSWRRQFLIWEN